MGKKHEATAGFSRLNRDKCHLQHPGKMVGSLLFDAEDNRSTDIECLQ